VKRLGVNIDHIATLRNARGESHPDPVLAANYVISKGADSVTIHLREDRRHIRDIDAKKICSLKNILVNLEISINSKIVNYALKIKPTYVCIVPEKREEFRHFSYISLVAKSIYKGMGNQGYFLALDEIINNKQEN